MPWLMVFRYKMELYDDPTWEYQTINFKVYKFNFETKIWVQVNDLGDVAMILGSNTSMSIRASRIHNCRRNCIYFSNDEWLFRNGIPYTFGGTVFILAYC
ncbi:uncharacterized protein At1g65760-like [Chenopodium quinoa]|uniref:uncharacterized protein At1g65760-like n=1 Tax=Chenopodium quinoa TaxID=63459 RepID=UPI000B77BE66|nr:uncharacterized protein At1g65760-like [Chenopodium quinoa]